MELNIQIAERVAEYYNDKYEMMRQCEDELRELWGDQKYDEGDHEGYLSHPQWTERLQKLDNYWSLSENDQEVLDYVLSVGLCDRFTAQDVMIFATL